MTTITDYNGIIPYNNSTIKEQSILYLEKVKLYNSAIKEQSILHIEKVKSFSESYIVSCAIKTLAASAALSLIGFSFSTTLPICFTVIVCTGLLGYVKAGINTLAEKCINLLIGTAKIVNDIFNKIFDFIRSLLSHGFYIAKYPHPQLPSFFRSPETPHSTEEELCVIVDDLLPQAVQALITEESKEDLLITTPTIEEHVAFSPQVIEEEQAVEEDPEIEGNSPTDKEKLLTKTPFLAQFDTGLANPKLAESLRAAFLFKAKYPQPLSFFRSPITTMNYSSTSQRLALTKPQQPIFLNTVKTNLSKPVGPSPYLVKGVKLLKFLKSR